MATKRLKEIKPIEETADIWTLLSSDQAHYLQTNLQVISAKKNEVI